MASGVFLLEASCGCSVRLELYCGNLMSAVWVLVSQVMSIPWCQHLLGVCVCVWTSMCCVCVVIRVLLCVVAPLFRDSMSMVVYMSGFLVSGDIPQLQPVVGHLLHFVVLLIECH